MAQVEVAGASGCWCRCYTQTGGTGGNGLAGDGQ